MLIPVLSDNFAAGYFGVPDYLTNYRQVITIENSVTGNNNTLAPNCGNRNRPDISGLGGTMANRWRDVYLQDALTRLSPQIEGLELTSSDLVGMQGLCAYEVSNRKYSVRFIEHSQMSSDHRTRDFRILCAVHGGRVEGF